MARGRYEFETAAESARTVLTRAATVLCLSRSDVEDCVQETLVRAYGSYGSFRGESSFATWASVILTRVAGEMNRRRCEHVPDDYVRSRPEPLPPVDEGLIADERKRIVVDAIRSLPLRQREMMTLYYLDEASYADVAKAMEVSVGTVKATLFKAKMSLRAMLSARKIDGR